MITRCVRIICALVICVAVYFPARHARHYEYIPLKKVIQELTFVDGTPHSENHLRNCSYEDLILKSKEVPVSDITKPKKFELPLRGGEYIPRQCNSIIKTAIVVPYRNRSEQLQIFLNYMHSFLQQQSIHYKLFVVEQNNSLPFNRAQMINYGASVAISLNYPCLVLHDVDLIPLSTGNIYACSERPRHMSSSLDTFRYNLPYLTLFGGAIAILSQQYEEVNGMSNLFFGWGGEDDDFYTRLISHNLFPYRFDPEISRYSMLFHRKQPKNEERYETLKKSLKENKNDGLNNLHRKYYIVQEDLFTRIVVF
ncbi:beta-1,4-N-acetylgalactosaminyltransferase bre-4 [Sitophilus oryzae]|uniref:Beta-1,4-N-acetylgalactosaminyltransferase n=1 Tax=Sitophilus oryzae TaxID=7048 RepID=A0A6J2YD45_SITOR|nr:beta-1,4-N-acetylgalactosaminyltransferase bre-4 [Sitophilus oryzae]